MSKHLNPLEKEFLIRQHHFSAQIQYGTQIGTVKIYAQKGLQTPAE